MSLSLLGFAGAMQKDVRLLKLGAARHTTEFHISANGKIEQNSLGAIPEPGEEDHHQHTLQAGMGGEHGETHLQDHHHRTLQAGMAGEHVGTHHEKTHEPSAQEGLKQEPDDSNTNNELDGGDDDDNDKDDTDDDDNDNDNTDNTDEEKDKEKAAEEAVKEEGAPGAAKEDGKEEGTEAEGEAEDAEEEHASHVYAPVTFNTFDMVPNDKKKCPNSKKMPEVLPSEDNAACQGHCSAESECVAVCRDSNGHCSQYTECRDGVFDVDNSVTPLDWECWHKDFKGSMSRIR